ncbi:MAG: efflux RND transporter periplasmic adaptor subunit [Bacteroidota bacterium]
MKNILFAFVILVFAASCGAPDKEMASDNLVDKLKALAEKKEELKTLQTEIETLEGEIAQLDTTEKEVKLRLVTAMPITKKDFESYVEIQGAVRAFKGVNASSEMGGRILRLTVDEGSKVRKGQLIAKTDTEAIDKSEEELNTSLSLARDLYDRQKRLWDQNIGTEVQYVQAKNQVEQLEKKLETLNVQRSKANVYAPLSGTVERVFLKEGELAGPGTPIVHILGLSKVKVVADVSETYLRNVREGQMVRITVPALDIDRDAKVSMIGRTVNPQNRTFKVEVTLPNPGGEIKPNLLATMFVKDYEAKEALVLPTELIQQDLGGRDFVFLVEEGPEHKVGKRVLIETGKSYNGETVIVDGLTGEESIVVKGSRDLSDGEGLQIQISQNLQ